MAGGFPASQPDGIEGLRRTIAALQRDVAALKGTAGIMSAVIGSGGVTVVDEDREPQVHVGQMAAGGYGVETRVGDAWVPLAALAGGANAATASGQVEISSGTGLGTSGWRVHGPTVRFTTYTGRFIVLLVVSQVSMAWATAHASYRLSGAQDRQPDRARSARMSTKDADASGSLVYAEMVQGQPGEVELSMAYETLGTAFDFPGTASYAGRSAIVLPF
ncbi:hypothetical protein [uncultured Aeromicrobium sp.]|uniref:hypothetical protein n=1 Tax=uncultured Aeromicrobium sp. TaxID=337820 RepID=UPI0025D23FC8|nr:hypothetical protein [uncultured Aeromicrobium sp.]